MGKTSTANTPSNQASFKLVELSVVLVAGQSDPSILNPDFLRYKKIVDPDLSLDANAPPISTPTFSQVVFKNGVVVKAGDNRIFFEQTGNPLTTGDICCPEIAKRFIDQLPNFHYQAVGINPKGIQTFSGNIKVSDALVDRGNWLSLPEAKPEVQLKTVYRLTDKIITLELIEGPDKTGQVLFQANIHRILKNEKDLSPILDSWKKDLDDFKELVTKFNFPSFIS